VRCFGVYGSTRLIGFVSLPILVTLLRHTLRKTEQASYIAAAVIMSVTALISFLGHKNISFREKLLADRVKPDSDIPGA